MVSCTGSSMVVLGDIKMNFPNNDRYDCLHNLHCFFHQRDQIIIKQSIYNVFARYCEETMMSELPEGLFYPSNLGPMGMKSSMLM